jgi:hypothetical protein
MATDDESPAIVQAVEASAPADVDDSIGFMRGLIYGLACAVPLWAVIIAALWLAL